MKSKGKTPGELHRANQTLDASSSSHKSQPHPAVDNQIHFSFYFNTKHEALAFIDKYLLDFDPLRFVTRCRIGRELPTNSWFVDCSRFRSIEEKEEFYG